jgi:membrane protease YdiL (CAAX protease family)
MTLGTFLVTAGALIMYYMGVLNWNDIIYSGSDLVFNLGLLAMIAVSEELIFRGYVLRNLMKSFNKWIALGISAALFTIVHYSNQGIPVLGIINTFLGGLVLGISFILTRSLWLPIFFHLSWNFIQGPILGFRVSGLTFQSLLISQSTGKVFITGGEYGFEGSVICTILLAITVAAGCYLHENL